MMLIATFGPTTGWAGKTITYDDGRFLLEGQGPIDVGAVMQFDRQGDLIWAADGTRAWVGAKALQGTSREKAKRPIALIALLLIVALVAGSAIIWALGHASGSADQAADAPAGTETGVEEPTSGKAKEAEGAWARVFSWSGGGSGRDNRQSPQFALKGGNQRAFVVTRAFDTEPGNQFSFEWAVMASDGQGVGMIKPPAVGSGMFEFRLPAGSYSLSSNTLNSTWTVTFEEQR